MLPEESVPKVLVAVASRHGSTREMAHAIADGLRAAGLDVDYREAREVTDVAGYDSPVRRDGGE